VYWRYRASAIPPGRLRAFLVAGVPQWKNLVETIAAALAETEDDEPDLGWTLSGSAAICSLHNLAAGYSGGMTQEYAVDVEGALSQLQRANPSNTWTAKPAPL
jgi:hypothetical protein